MKRLILLAMVLLPAALWAHTPLLVVEDNGDGTIYIEGGFSNGASAAGTDIIVRSKESDEILWQGKLPEESYVEIDMPGEAYTVTLDAGPGHVVTEDGPEPAGGFGAVTTADAEETADEVAEEGVSPSPNQAGGGPATWDPSMTMGAIPPAPMSIFQILMVIIGFILVAVLIYIAVTLRRSRQ
jgi:hypothetical protein